MSNNTEVSVNPDILFNPYVDKYNIKAHGLKLKDNANLIPLEKVSTTTYEKPPMDINTLPEGGSGLTWKNNKVFYKSSQGQKEYMLANRIKSILDDGGILHMKSGAKYVVRDKIIIGIRVHGDLVKPYQKIPKHKIENKFGKASRIKEDYEQTDGALWNTNYYYDSREMVVSFFEPDNKINYINFGLFPFGVNNNLS